MNAPCGLLLVDKPSGWTSHDAVAVLRRRLPRGCKVGHCGTLDPIATGLLLLLAGPATRRQSEFMGLDKVYSGSLRLGVSTDTGDLAGKVVRSADVPPLTLADFRQLPSGRLEMPAPAYSAVKHKGRRLYEYARAGLEVPVKPRVCQVHEWKALGYAAPELAFRLSCSSGTYVRSLAELLGRRLGCGAAVVSLRREAVGNFRVEQALGAEALKTIPQEQLLPRFLSA
ncbi:MAG: tRNA pseudouridine(55) synthase TruB [Elusimicrobia bacterium]|nr:tRNA pseudouridine(55) synthase TruB [Elusimicrobiota bacterium]MDE2236673.1 tRNA pseudouridine(55) synthase TruB [Elusimicrobiota bacterium]MDE2425470.1 tRNA pseudouridine(55) synthase TruB [Elusimicrobiota bacterium]